MYSLFSLYCFCGSQLSSILPVQFYNMLKQTELTNPVLLSWMLALLM